MVGHQLINLSLATLFTYPMKLWTKEPVSDLQIKRVEDGEAYPGGVGGLL